ncbi:MAG: DUF418 domain-containing protein [Novosphingobium sp.]
MDEAVQLAPVRGRDRIAVLDILRGFAILGIFYMNIPFMSGPVSALLGNIRAMGWTVADRTAWAVTTIGFEGTQRGMLEFLFGAGLMVTAAKAMEGDGPVAVADLYIRRNLWLLAFGLIDIFLLLWPGDILHVYALCALALFPFRKLSVKWLLVLGLLFPTITAVGGVAEYIGRSEMQATYNVATAKEQQGQKLSEDETEAVKEWRESEKRIAGQEPEMVKMAKEETAARAGSFGDYAGFMIGSYMWILSKGGLLFGVIEAFGTMLVGIALWKLGFIQGKRTTREYLVVLLLAYAFGLGARYLGVMERLTFAPVPKTIWATQELARLAVSLGHVALINLLVRAAAGKALLAPLKAAGQMAFSLYFMEQIVGVFILFSPLGLHLPGAQGWAHLAWQATLVVAGLLVFANLWMRYYVSGPLECVWRSLAYNKKQPFRRIAAPPPD